ncbi:response regulator [Pseudanabaena minima]|uniref:ATP-binding response regulator n=1 Tax=Pseudanabaena minima TaxID=890415 RepID=UPI003DA894FC
MDFPMIEIATQTKTIFSKEAQAFTYDLKNKILELDVNLPKFQQQIDGLISVIKLLQDAAIKADFYIPSSSFGEIIYNFELLINQFRDRHAEIDWITKELMIELINMSNQIINEYCLGIDLARDWLELQRNLFAQINEHLQSEENEISSQSILKLHGLQLHNRENEPFNLEDTPEALHLFDLDFDLDPNQEEAYINPTNNIDNSDSFLMIQIDQEDQEDNYLDPDQLFQDTSGSSADELSILFPNLLGDSCTSELDGLTENLQDSHETSNEERLPVPELFTDMFSVMSAQQLNDASNDDETEIQGVSWHDYEVNVGDLGGLEDSLEPEDTLDNVWAKFTAMESYANSNDDEDLVPAFDLSDFALSDFDLSELSNDDIEEDMTASSFFESTDLDISSLDAEPNLQPKEPTSSHPPELDSSLMLAEMLKEDFPASDIDTAIEESPIYQNNPDDANSAWNDLSLMNFGDKEISYEDFSALSLDVKPEMDADVSSIDNSQLDVQIATKVNDATIRLPLNHLEMLGDLSEELLVRKGSLDIYLSEIKILSEDAQKHLQLLVSSSDSQPQTAIAGLQNAVEQINSVLALTEQQTYAMSQDVYQLRKNLRQVLKHPISSLVRKFPRILRDLSLQYGKQVELVVQGAEVEVERLISETVAEPLELLLRNAFKHGIEPPLVRQQQGKASQGKIEFIVTQTDESTIIKVSDDGCGINIEKIRHQVEQSAAIAGMSGFSTMDMSDEQLMGLIFEPSFNLVRSNSYTETGTRLCDVKKKLRELGGTIAVQSQRGKGTQFTLVLPNILSLIRVLLIDINQMCLAIPSKIILEVVPCDHNDHDFEQPETFQWRDRVLPIVRLNSLLKLNCRHSLSQASPQSNRSPQSINSAESHKPAHAVPSFLVISYENHLFALQTDGCWHDQEATFHQIEGDIILPQIFLGTVILGSNQAVALLNPAELVNQFLHAYGENVLESQPTQSSMDNLSSLSDFFNAGDSVSEPLLVNPLGTVSESSLERSPETENLESSGLFTSELVSHQVRRSHQPRILIVDSSANVRRYLAMTLTKSGFLTEQVQDGKEAIAFLKDCLGMGLNVDVVITDLEMPHMDGFKLLSNIRTDADFQNLPIIVLTTKNNENDQKLALDLGANAYFSKPYREQELVKKLHQLISG